MNVTFFVLQQIVGKLQELEDLCPAPKKVRAEGIIADIRVLIGEKVVSHKERGSKISEVFAYKRARERFSITRPDDSRRVEVHGWENICRVLGIPEPSLRVKFSHGRGRFEISINQVKDGYVAVHRLGLLEPGQELLPFDPRCLDALG